MENKKQFTTEEAKKIGEELGIDWSKFDVEQFRMGMDVELEHGLVDSHTNVTNDDSLMTGKIALAQPQRGPQEVEVGTIHPRQQHQNAQAGGLVHVRVEFVHRCPPPVSSGLVANVLSRRRA